MPITWTVSAGDIAAILSAIGILIYNLANRRSILLTAERNAQESMTKTIANLSSQLNTATEADGNLRGELKRMHDKDDSQQTQIDELLKQKTLLEAEIGRVSDINVNLTNENRDVRAENAINQRKLIDANAEKLALNSHIIELTNQLEEAKLTIAKQGQRITELESGYRLVRKTTDELEKNTRPLK